MKPSFGEIIGNPREQGPVSLRFQKIEIVFRNGFQKIFIAPELFQRVTEPVDRNRDGNAGKKAMIHFRSARGERCGDQHTASQGVQSGKNGFADRDVMQTGQERFSILQNRQIARMNVQAWKVRNQIGQRNKTGQKAEIRMKRRNLFAQFGGPELSDTVSLLGGD